MKRLLSAPSEEWRSEGDLLLRHALGVARHLGAGVELLAHPFGQAEGTVPRSGLDLHGAALWLHEFHGAAQLSQPPPW